MSSLLRDILTKIKDWHPLTEIPEHKGVIPIPKMPLSDKNTAVDKSCEQFPQQALLNNVTEGLKKLLWDVLCYPYSSVSARIKRLRMSGRELENAKREGCEKSFIIESSAGQTLYLIPTDKSFDAFGMSNPYKRKTSTEHAFYVSSNCFLLEKDPAYRSVRPEVPLGKSGAASDIVTTAHNGTTTAWEITLSTTNILANASKYENTGFAKIVFLCRNYQLREAVKACCREGGLNPNLLARLEYMHFSQLLRRQRKLYGY